MNKSTVNYYSIKPGDLVYIRKDRTGDSQSFFVADIKVIKTIGENPLFVFISTKGKYHRLWTPPKEDNIYITKVLRDGVLLAEVPRTKEFLFGMLKSKFNVLNYDN